MVKDISYLRKIKREIWHILCTVCIRIVRYQYQEVSFLLNSLCKIWWDFQIAWRLIFIQCEYLNNSRDQNISICFCRFSIWVTQLTKSLPSYGNKKVIGWHEWTKWESEWYQLWTRYMHRCHMSRIVTKPTKWHVRPAKTRISLGIRPVWSESSLSAWRQLGSLATHWAHSKHSDQTGRMPRLTCGTILDRDIPVGPLSRSENLYGV